MKYIIADPDTESGAGLLRLLDEDCTLVFDGSYTTLKAAEAKIRDDPPDIAFIRLGKAELNALRLAGFLREQKPDSKIIFFGSQKEDAVEAFEFGADWFLQLPFSKGKIGQSLQQSTKKEEIKN